MPIALLGAFKAKRKDDWRIKPGIITTRFGEPIKKDEIRNFLFDERLKFFKFISY